MRRQMDLLHNLVRSHAHIHAPDALVMNVLDGVPVIRGDGVNFFSAENRLAMAGNHDFGLEFPDDVHALIPAFNAAVRRPPDRIQIGKGAVQVVPGHQNPRSFQPDVYGVVGFPGRINQLHFHAGDFHVHFIAKGLRGRDVAKLPVRADAQKRTNAIVLQAFLVQKIAEHTHAAITDDGLHLADKTIHVIAQVFVSVDLRLAALRKGLGAENVVGVVVGCR